MLTTKRYLSYSILFSSIFIGFIFNVSFYKQSQIGLFYPIFWLILISIIEFAKCLKNEKFSFKLKDLLFLAVLIPAFSVLFNESSGLNSWIIIFNVISFWLISLYVVWDEKIKAFGFLNNFLMFFSHYVGQFIGLKDFLKNLSFPVKTKHSSLLSEYLPKVIIGSVIAVPFLCFYFILFSASDELFTKIIEEAGFKNIEKLIGEDGIAFMLLWGLVSAIALLFLVGSFFFNRSKSEIKSHTFIDPFISVVFMFLINTLFFLFIISQFIYLFGDHDVAVDLGIVYSEYARRGFNEMMVIAVFTLGLIYAIKSFTRKENKVFNALLNVLLSFNVLFNLVIIFSSYTRLNLYVDGYGLSLTRFYVYVALAFVALLFVAVLTFLSTETYYYINRKIPGAFLFNVFSLFIFLGINLTLGFAAFLNPDAFVAEYNIDRFQNLNVNNPRTDQFDPYYIQYLSPTAYSKLLLNEEIESTLELSQKCSMAIDWLYEKDSQTIQGFKISRYLIEDKLDDYFETKGYIDADGTLGNVCYGGPLVSPPF